MDLFPCIVDVQAGQHKSVCFECSATLTASRGKEHGWYLPWRSQKISSVEMARLQALPDSLVAAWRCHGVCDKDIGFALGNAVSANVLERLLSKVLSIAGLVGKPCDDFWASLPPLPSPHAKAIIFPFPFPSDLVALVCRGMVSYRTASFCTSCSQGSIQSGLDFAKTPFFVCLCRSPGFLHRPLLARNSRFFHASFSKRIIM